MPARYRDGIPNSGRAFTWRSNRARSRLDAAHRWSGAKIRGRRDLHCFEHSIKVNHVTRHRLFEMRIAFEWNYGRLIFIGANHIFDERARGGFFVRQRAFFRDAHVNHKSNCQWPISLALKGEERLRHAVFQNANVVLLERCDIAIVLVGGGEQKIREIGFSADYVDVLLRSLRLSGEEKPTNQKQQEIEN